MVGAAEKGHLPTFRTAEKQRAYSAADHHQIRQSDSSGTRVKEAARRTP